MKKQILTLAIGILLLASASALYGGECESINVSELENLDNLAYAVVGNQSDLIGLNVYLKGTIVNVCPVLNYKPDNFTLIFFDNSIIEKEVIVYRNSGSSGGSSRTVYKNVTEYVETFRYLDRVVYVNETNETEIKDIIEEEVGFFKRIWNWIQGLFSRN